jgi:hypothetical protein
MFPCGLVDLAEYPIGWDLEDTTEIDEVEDAPAPEFNTLIGIKVHDWIYRALNGCDIQDQQPVLLSIGKAVRGHISFRDE